jgi:hypothetical protein
MMLTALLKTKARARAKAKANPKAADAIVKASRAETKKHMAKKHMTKKR